MLHENLKNEYNAHVIINVNNISGRIKTSITHTNH